MSSDPEPRAAPEATDHELAPTAEMPAVPRPATAPPDAPDQLRPADSAAEPDKLKNLIKLRLILAGVDPAEVDAVDETAAPTLLRTRLLWGDDEPITLAEVAQRAGLDVEVCRRARMLMGLPDPGDAPVCRSQEIDTFRGFAAGIELYGEEAILQFTRVLGSAMASVAEGALSVFGRQLADQEHPPQGDQYVLAAFDALESFRIVPEVLGIVAKLQFDLATDRLDGEPGLMREGTIGFVDLTGSTKATEKLGTDAMAPALTRFEEWAAELAVAADGRVVKYIGDEVMFLSPDLGAAAVVATELIERVHADPVLRSARAGLAHGPLLSRDGDWYGSTVNLAARLVDRAKAGTVLLTGDGASDVPGASARGKRRIRDLPERVELWRIG
jgi:class 3 adenylate cyclase